ncbi:MAG: ZIP family metal transporter [Chitinophagales bacterium]|nr:ZIP family metal transporter [Chitinophagales bacterium]
MSLTYSLLLFAITFLGGSIPLWNKRLNDDAMQYLLAFSGAFLLSMTLLHLLPETFEEIGSKAGIFLLAGFFIQLFIQRLTHGVEHGHAHIHVHDGHKHIPITSIMLGLTIHAFMEGLPLGFNYRMDSTEPALYMAVAAHKLPEAILATSLIHESYRSKTKTVIGLFIFSMITPFSGIFANMLGMSYHFISQMVIWLIPIVAGAFIHISTTIFYESGTKSHMLTAKKILAILFGIGIGLLTLAFE